eukprot:m.511787 g.511787  ORF g.511787 m.511787 type:complete len:405 (-) comp57432_c0_seq12:323-1537(-)
MLLIHEPRTTTDDLLSKALDGSGIVSFCEPVFIAYQRSRPAANLALHSDQSTVLMWWSSGDSDVLAAGNVFALSIDLQQRCIVPLRETSTASYIYDMWFSRCTNDLIYTIEGQSSNIDDFSIKLVFYNATFSPSPRVSPAPLLEYVDAFPLALSAPLVAHAMNSSETVFALATLNKELHVFDLQRQQSFTSALLMEASTLLWDDTDSVLIVGSRTGVLQLFDQLAMPLHLISMSDDLAPHRHFLDLASCGISFTALKTLTIYRAEQDVATEHGHRSKDHYPRTRVLLTLENAPSIVLHFDATFSAEAVSHLQLFRERLALKQVRSLSLWNSWLPVHLGSSSLVRPGARSAQAIRLLLCSNLVYELPMGGTTHTVWRALLQRDSRDASQMLSVLRVALFPASRRG